MSITYDKQLEIIDKWKKDVDKQIGQHIKESLPLIKKLSKHKNAKSFKHGVAVNCDLFDIQPELSKVKWGLVAYDPPFIKYADKNTKKDLWDKVYGKDDSFYFNKFIPTTVKAIAPLVGNSLVLFGNDMSLPPFVNEFTKNGVTLRRLCTWVRSNARPVFTYGETPSKTGEPVAWMAKAGEKGMYRGYRTGKNIGTEYYGSNVLSAPTNVPQAPYPFSKPTKLMDRIVSEFGYPPVLDPMAGYLVTGVVCEKAGYPWVCIEIDKDRFDKGIARFEKLV